MSPPEAPLPRGRHRLGAGAVRRNQRHRLPAADPGMTARLGDCNAHLAALLRQGRRHTPYGPGLPSLTEEALVGAVAAILSSRLEPGREEELTALEPQVARLLLIPYVGVAEAARAAGGG